VRLGCASFGAPFKDTWNGIRDRLNESFLKALDTAAPQRHPPAAAAASMFAVPGGGMPSAAPSNSLPPEVAGPNQSSMVYASALVADILASNSEGVVQACSTSDAGQLGDLCLVPNSSFDVSHELPTGFAGPAVDIDHNITAEVFCHAREYPNPYKSN